MKTLVLPLLWHFSSSFPSKQTFTKENRMEPCKYELDHEWVINLSQALQEDDFDEESDDPELVSSVSIFEVPKTLLTSKPEAYTPQVVAIGPYHHRRLELLEMERYKLHSAKRVQKNLKELKFQYLVNQIAQVDLRARACYYRYFDFGPERLAWLFAIDASFLLEYLQTYSTTASWEGSTTSVSLKISHLIDPTRRKAAHQAILRDFIMLENQMPLFLVREVHKFCQQENQNDEIWVTMLMGFCKHLAPIKYVDKLRFREDCFTKTHLLELLYYTVAPSFPFQGDQKEKAKKEPKEMYGNFTIIGAFCSIFQLICFITWAPIHFLMKICRSEIAMLLITIPWKIIVYIFKIPGKNAVKDVLSFTGNVVEEAENECHGKDESPLVEEIAIPSVTELSEIGVKFCPTKGGLSTIKFDKTCGVFYLPVIHLNDNSDVILRNLVAYEACIGPEAMIFTRYTELMNGMIDTEEDVRVLREAGILLNSLKSDEEVASLWNGMTKSVKVTKVPILDKAIEGANGYYSASWKVKVKAALKKYVYGSWPVLTFLAANVLILLSVTETVCSMYQCSQWLNAI